MLRRQQSLPDCLDTVIVSASEGEVDSDLKGVHGQLTGKCGNEHLFVLLWDVDLREDSLGVAEKIG